MGIGDMYQAQRDAEDAKRYRWLRNKYARGVQTYFAENCASDCSRNPSTDSIKMVEILIDAEIDELISHGSPHTSNGEQR